MKILVKVESSHLSLEEMLSVVHVATDRLLFNGGVSCTLRDPDSGTPIGSVEVAS